jgi:hypothetical protein
MSFQLLEEGAQIAKSVDADQLRPPIVDISRTYDVQTATVTRRKVAEIEVASSLGIAFWALKRASNSYCRSASRPFAAAASNAFTLRSVTLAS